MNRQKHVISGIILGLAIIGIGLWISHSSSGEPKKKNDQKILSAQAIVARQTPLSTRNDALSPQEKPVVTAVSDIAPSISGEDDDLNMDRENLHPAVPKKISLTDHADQRIQLNPNETVEVRLDRREVDPSRPLTIRADDGGVIDGRNLQSEVLFAAGAIPQSFTFTLGKDRGLYVVSIIQGDYIERLEFWAGAPLPKGAAGPQRNITPPEVLQ